MVSTQWLDDHLDDPGLVVVESDEDVLLYDTGHIPGAVKIDWHTDLNHPTRRDYIGPEAFARLMGRSGIGRETTVVLYGDRSNWWAAYTLWVLGLYGHPDARLLDGGRDRWIAEGRRTSLAPGERTPLPYPVTPRDDRSTRAFRHDVLDHAGRPLIDIRSPREYRGEVTSIPDHPEEGVLRGGHIPGARNVPWARATTELGTYRSRADLEALYFQEVGLRPDDEVITYCRIGERSSHTWFALTHLLGMPGVRNYDGSWTEWGNAVGVPIAVGAEAGSWDTDEEEPSAQPGG
nr:sulfurtransferase [Kineococcus aurantiacus]